MDVQLADEGADVHDCPALAGSHVRYHGSGCANGTKDVGVERLLYTCIIQVYDRSWKYGEALCCYEPV